MVRLEEVTDDVAARLNASVAEFVCRPRRRLAEVHGWLGRDQALLDRLWRYMGQPMMRMTFHNWYGLRRWMLRFFGARVHPSARIRPTVRISHPWNLTVGAHSAIGDDAVVFCPVPVSIGDHCTISQYTCLCSAAINHRDLRCRLVHAPIVIESGAWVAADVYVGPGVRVGRDAVVGSRSTVLSDVPRSAIVVGDDARPVGRRVLRRVPRRPSLF